MKRLINVTAGLLLLGVSTDTPSPPKGEVAPPDTPYTRKFPDDKLTRIQPTKEGEETLKRLADAGEKLLKTPSKTGEESVSEKSLEWLTTAVKDIPDASLKPVDEKGYHHALVIKKGDKKEDVWYVHAADDGIDWWVDGPAEFVLINKEDPQMFAIFNRKSPSAKKDSQHLLDSLDEARIDADSQKKDPAGAKKFDLTKKRPIGYLCFNGFDKGDKESRKQYYEYSHALPELLRNCGYDMVCLDNNKRIEELNSLPTASGVAGLVANPTVTGVFGGVAGLKASTTPANLVEQRIDALHKRGVRDFYLNFLTHGDKKEGMGSADGIWLKGEDLKRILLKYKDSTFAIDATGCEGGGLIGMMREFKDVPEAPEGRVVVFVHTKENLSILSHEYQSLLIKELMDMANGVPGAPKTYGEAHYGADIVTKRITDGAYDPQFWKSMPGKKSVHTAKNDIPQQNSPRTRPIVEAATQSLAGDIPPASPDGSGPRREWTGKIIHDEPKGRC